MTSMECAKRYRDLLKVIREFQVWLATKLGPPGKDEVGPYVLLHDRVIQGDSAALRSPEFRDFALYEALLMDSAYFQGVFYSMVALGDDAGEKLMARIHECDEALAEAQRNLLRAHIPNWDSLVRRRDALSREKPGSPMFVLARVYDKVMGEACRGHEAMSPATARILGALTDSKGEPRSREFEEALKDLGNLFQPKV